MAEQTNFYESMFIVDLSNGEEAVKTTVDKFTSLISANGEIIEVRDKAPYWGKRRLAYAINDKNEGYYVVVTFKAEPEFPNEFYRLLNIDENIMRAIVLKLEYEPTVTSVAEEITANVSEEAAAVTEDAAVVEAAATVTEEAVTEKIADEVTVDETKTAEATDSTDAEKVSE